MSRYDGLIIPRSYSEYINKTDAATLQQALQQSGVMDAVPTTGSNNPVKSGGVKTELEKYINKTDAATLQQALQQSGVMDDMPTTGSNNPVKSGGVKTELEKYINKTDAATLQQALQQSGVMDDMPTTGSNNPVKSGGVKTELEKYINKTDAATLSQALQLSGVMDNAPTAGSNNPVKSGGVKTELEKYIQFRAVYVPGAGTTYEIPVDPNDIWKCLIIQGWIYGVGPVLDIISYYDTGSASINHILEIASLSYETTTVGMLKITNNTDQERKGFRGKVILIF